MQKRTVEKPEYGRAEEDIVGVFGLLAEGLMGNVPCHDVPYMPSQHMVHALTRAD